MYVCLCFCLAEMSPALSRAGYVPHWLSRTSGKHKVPHVALVAGAVPGFVVMMAVYLIKGEGAGAFIGAQLLNMAVFGVAIWYVAGIIYFAAYGRKTLVYSPEEDLAVKARTAAGLDKA